MAQIPARGYRALRRGRWSAPGREYFLTCCTKGRSGGLSDSKVMPVVISGAIDLEAEGRWQLRSAVVMPDHVHLLAIIGDSVDLAGAVRLFKGRLTPTLRQVGVEWQPAFFDHQLRPSEDRMPVFLYLFLNPYRKGLLPPNEAWSGYYCGKDDWAWFGALTKHDAPMPEWLL